MKKQVKFLFALACVLALAGTAVASSLFTVKTLEAQYMGIRLTVDGQEVTPKTEGGDTVEPFMVDGTVYLPVRAMGQAVGKAVTWDQKTHTVALESPFYQDARTLVETIESSHPAFVLDDLPEGYAAAKETFLKTAAQPGLSSVQFAWATMAYTSAMQDGHTQMYGMVGGMPQLEVKWAADGEHLFLLDESGKATSREVTQIGGVPVKDVFAVADTYFAAENQAGRDHNHGIVSTLNSALQIAGADVSSDKAVLTVLEGGKETQMTAKISVPVSGGAREVAIYHERMGDVFYVDLNSCVLGAQTDATVKALADAVKAGTTKVIIDVRGNGGGNAMACEQLLGAMGMEAPWYGAYVRVSELARATYPDEFAKIDGDLSQAPDATKAKQNPAIQLVVLTDAQTFSSATMMGVYVQDGKLGTVIGRASSNAPTSYGDVLSYTLPNSQFSGGVSYKQWQRPDTTADQKTLVPDIETALSEDALAAALSFLSGKS